jgi:CBS-domain-containing membrane protein
MLGSYFSKWKGDEKAGPVPMPTLPVLLNSTIGGFLAMGLLSAISVLTEGMDDGYLALIGSYGASVVLIFGAPTGPFSQPRNVLFGNFIASVVGVGCRVWVADPMGSVGLAVPLGTDNCSSDLMFEICYVLASYQCLYRTTSCVTT